MAEDTGIRSKVTEAWALEDIYFKVNGTEICDIDIVGFEALYGGCNIPAKASFIDSKGLTTGDTEGSANIGIGGVVEVGYTTAQGCSYKDEFIITKVQTQTNSHNQKLITLTLEDKDTRNMKGSYTSKGYPDKKFSETIESHFEEIGSKALNTGKELFVHPPEKELKLNMVIPGHIDFYTFLNREMKDKGYKYIKDKTANYLIHTSNKEFDKLNYMGDIYEYDTNPFSFTRIVQFHIDGFDLDAYLASIPTANTSIDLVTNNSEDNKDGLDTKISQKDPSKSVKTKTSGVNPGDLAKGKGSKQGRKTAQDQQYFETISKAQKCSIWAPGRTDNMVGRKIQVKFPKPSYYMGTDDDKIFSGEWEVYLVRDKVIGAYYMQELFLRRPGGTNK